MTERPTGVPTREGAPGGHDERISALEWVVAGLGLLLVVAAVAFLVLDALRGGSAPPLLRVRADSVIATGDGYVVQFTATNDGRETAADVGIVGELRDAAGVETSRARLDYVPGRSERRGGLYFRGDPRRTPLRVWAEGYQEP